VNQDPGDGRAFDLSEISEKLYVGWLRRKWWTAVFMIGVLTAASGAMIILAVYDATIRGLPGRATADLVLVAFFASLALLLYFTGNSASRHPATELQLSAQALAISYPNGRRARFSWSDPKFSLRISKMRSATLGSEVAYSTFWWYPRLYMSEDVSSALEETARGRGLSVERAKDANSPSGESTLITNRQRLRTSE
jgi:hypothetical protein